MESLLADSLSFKDALYNTGKNHSCLISIVIGISSQTRQFRKLGKSSVFIFQEKEGGLKKLSDCSTVVARQSCTTIGVRDFDEESKKKFDLFQGKSLQQIFLAW